MADPQVPIDVDPATGIWTTDGLPMIYMPRHFFVNYYSAMDEALGREKHHAMLFAASHKSGCYAKTAAPQGRLPRGETAQPLRIRLGKLGLNQCQLGLDLLLLFHQFGCVERMQRRLIFTVRISTLIEECIGLKVLFVG